VKNVPTESFQMTTPDGGAAFNYAIRVPKGVIAVVAPWNLPLLLMTWKVGSCTCLRELRGGEAVGRNAVDGDASR
jgi:acyl-CoA reductase-like NAD-dependent aldehyde dehydrogenase